MPITTSIILGSILGSPYSGKPPHRVSFKLGSIQVGLRCSEVCGLDFGFDYLGLGLMVQSVGFSLSALPSSLILETRELLTHVFK